MIILIQAYDAVNVDAFSVFIDAFMIRALPNDTFGNILELAITVSI